METAKLFKQGYEVLEQLENVFKCTICTQKPNDPHICGYCSKFYCLQCVLDVSESPQADGKCPNCKEILQDKLVRVMWMNEISKLDDLKMLLLKNEAAERKNAQILGDLISNHGDNEKCSIHNHPLSIFCQNCKIVICMTCCTDILHKGHIYKTVVQEYSYAMISLNKQYHDVEACSNKYGELIKTSSENLEEVKCNKEKMLFRIKTLGAELQEKEKTIYMAKLKEIDDKFHACVQNICAQEQYKRIIFKHEINEFTKVQDGLEAYRLELGKLKSQAMSKVVGRQQKILEKTLDELRKTTYATRLVELKSTRLYETKVEFLLKGCSKLSNDFVKSPITIDMKGNKWRLEVNLWEDKTSIGCFLELVEPTEPIEAKFSIQMHDQETKKAYESDPLQRIFFDKGISLSWGFQHFIKVPVALNYLNREDDSMLFVGLVTTLP